MEGVSRHVKFDNPKDMESPRFRAVLRATSSRRRRPPTNPDVKSFSHELNSKGSRPPPIPKLRGVKTPEEMMAVIRSKFNKLKEEVDSELGIFAGDLVGILEKAVDEPPEWREALEDLLVTTQKCAEMSPDDFWLKCESIVQNLDDHRQELPLGTLKKVHTRILFILTRCTRLLQFQKEGYYGETDHALKLHQLSDLGLYPDARNGLKSSSSSKDMRDRYIRKRIQELRHHSQDLSGSHSPTDSPGSRARISSWKKLPSANDKSQSKLPDKKNEPPGKKTSDPSPQIQKTKFCADEDIESIDASKLCSEIIATSEELLSKTHEVSSDDSGDRPIPTDGKLKMICRICEFEIPTLYAEGHFRVCTMADRCDIKGLSIDERLDKVAEILEKILLSFTSTSSDLTLVIEGMDGSPDYLSDLITNHLNEVHVLSSSSQSTLTSGSMTPYSSLTPSPLMTPRVPSPLLTPRTTQLGLLLNGTKAFSDLENFQQIESLLNIVHCIEKIKTYNYSSLECLNSYLYDLNAVVDTRKVDALVVETFGRRIAKLLQEKFIYLCGQIDDGTNDASSMMSDEDGNLLSNSLGTKIKDRTSIEDFEIIKPISRGAFGRVFLAKKRVTGDIFAIKVLKKADMIRKNAVESILAERDILISTRNPFVVRFYYSFTCKENLYLVMEYINGGDLYSLLRNMGCLDEEMAHTYIAEVVLALEYLHSMNIIHRDLKPDNLLIGRDGHIKLTDFGLSKVGLINSTDDLSGPDVSAVLLGDDKPLSAVQLAQKREQRQKQSAIGTPDYLAPEILLGIPHGPTADWWAVGIILFELLVGIPPFNAEHPQKIFDNIMNRDITWPQVPEEMSFEAYDLINKLLIENPTQRLGATGAAEVKAHSFFKDINWDMLAKQKAAFIPSTEDDYDTSYFESRHTWKGTDNNILAVSLEDDDASDTFSPSYCSSSDEDEDGDECGSMTEFAPTLSVKYSFSNFSFKNISQLASMNYDLITKCSQDSENGSEP